MFKDSYFISGDDEASERKLSQQWLSGCVCGVFCCCYLQMYVVFAALLIVSSFECHLNFYVSILFGNHLAERSCLTSYLLNLLA